MLWTASVFLLPQGTFFTRNFYKARASACIASPYVTAGRVGKRLYERRSAIARRRVTARFRINTFVTVKNVKPIRQTIKPHSEQFSERMEFVCRPSEKRLIQEAVKVYGVTASQLVRHYCLLQSKFILEQENNNNGKGINRPNQALKSLRRALIKSR
jgi:hypothetical protein